MGFVPQGIWTKGMKESRRPGDCAIKIIDGDHITETGAGWSAIGCNPPIIEIEARSMFYAIRDHDPFQKIWPVPTITEILTGKGYYPYYDDEPVWKFHNDTQSRVKY